LLSCNQEANYKNIKRPKIEPPKTVKNIRIDKIHFDTIFIKQIAFSGKGFFDFSTDSVIFFDDVFATASTYSFEGKKGTRHLGLGNGPSEIRGFQNYVYHNGKHIFMNNWNVYTYNRNWQLENIKTITFDVRHSEKELMNNPRPDYQGIYEVKYFQNKITFINDSIILFNIESSHPLFNFLMHKEYYKESRIFAKLNYNTELVDEIFGYKPLTYLNYHFIPSFDYYHYYICDDKIYINFEPDSLIYIYDFDFNFIKAFGLAGNMKNINYIETDTYQKYYNLVKDERTSKGYYYDIYVIPEKNIILRCYKTGITPESDSEINPERMQIYRNDTLIGDIPTPFRFKNITFKKPYFYADGYIDAENNIVGFYRFKL
jgi:hypothetical protein